MAEEFGEEAEQTVSIQEYLDGVEEQELEADLVLGGDEGKECTYVNGYMKRQAIFSCLTCTPDGNAGVCTACSLACHDGHEIVELWTKRNFRCDCGNSKFGEFFCKLLTDKDIENVDNLYNHNFKGLYCICGRPYPDPDLEEQLEMIQCCICEDWLHEEHLGLESSDEIPRDEEGEPQYEDFICETCSEVFSFLTLYPQVVQKIVKNPENVKKANGKEVLEDPNPGCNSRDTSLQESVKIDHSEIAAGTEVVPDGKSPSPEQSSDKLMELKPCTEDMPSGATCIIGVDLVVASPVSEKRRPIFLSKSWRECLCKCEKCISFYLQKRISFLLEKEDSIAEYENMAKEKREEKLQQQEGVELNFLNKLGHVEKMEILSGIADMKNELHSFLESFDSSKPITSEDVHQVFENLAKKRRREQ